MKEIPNKAIAEKKENGDDPNVRLKLPDGVTEKNGIITESYRMPFLMLGLDLPPPPLFKDVMEKNIIPQVFGAICLCLVIICRMQFMSY